MTPLARIDKTDSAIGVFRAPLNADLAADDYDKVIGVGLNTSGRVVKGAGNTGIVGVIVPVKGTLAAGDIMDVLTTGEIVEVDQVSLTAGTAVTADTTTGAIGVTAASDTKRQIGHTVETDRIVVRFAYGITAAVV